MGLGIQGVHHIALSVPDIALARKFYIELLGAVEEVPPLIWRDNPFIDAAIGLPGSAAEQFMCRLGNTHFEVFEYHTPRSPPQEPDRGVHHFGYTHFALQVADIAATYEKLLAAGIRCQTPPPLHTITRHADGSKSGYCAIYCRDFFGNVFELIEIHPNDDIKAV